jgi:5-hydroxyisourate hydrolase
MRSPITTHVLDTSKGLPAVGVRVRLDFHETPSSWKELAEGVTNAEGRISDFLPESTRLAAGIYRLTFDTASYFHAQGTESFFPTVAIVFEISKTTLHYHVPLLLSPFGYSTYRGT